VYGASVPIEKVLDGSSDVLLAFEMNGESLPPDHGYPLRVVVPGVTGARSVKWLDSVITSSDESSAHWQQFDYKSFSPNTDWDNVDFSSAPAIQETPITSAITQPTAGSALNLSSSDSVLVKGYAFSGGGRAVIRVDVSPDQGKTWCTADLHPKPLSEPQSLSRAWAWSTWSLQLPREMIEKAADGNGVVTLTCKAVDAAYNSQPEAAAPIWNLRGVVVNSWHQVPVQLKGKQTMRQTL
jgi:sulfite oxidase